MFALTRAFARVRAVTETRGCIRQLKAQGTPCRTAFSSRSSPSHLHGSGCFGSGLAGAPLGPFSVPGARAATLSCLGSPLAAGAAAGSAAAACSSCGVVLLEVRFPTFAAGGSGRWWTPYHSKDEWVGLGRRCLGAAITLHGLRFHVLARVLWRAGLRGRCLGRVGLGLGGCLALVLSVRPARQVENGNRNATDSGSAKSVARRARSHVHGCATALYFAALPPPTCRYHSPLQR